MPLPVRRQRPAEGTAPAGEAPARPSPYVASTDVAPVAVQRAAGRPIPTTAREVAAGNGNRPGAQTPAALATPPGRPRPSTGETLSTTALLDRVDEMMGQLQERILEELERRGGRFTGYF
jgi:hypothetical protein